MALTQSHFRFGVVELAEATHGWKAAEDFGIQAEPGDQVLMRVCLQNDAVLAANNTVMQWQCRKLPQGDVGQATAWANIDSVSSIILRTGSTTVFTNGQHCTKRLSGTGTFEASGAGCTHDGSAGGNANDILILGCSETLIGVQLLNADVDQGDVVEVRVVGSGGTPFGAYAAVPRITVSNIYTIAEVSLNAGATGERISPPIPTASPGYSLTIQQVGWPQTGGPALEVSLEISYDGQQSWESLVPLETFPDEFVAASRTIPENAFRVTASIDPEQGGIKRRLRLSYHAIKAITVSGVIVSI